MTRKQQFGISLVESLVTLAVSGSLLGGALPSLQGVVEKQRLQAAGETLRSDLAEARLLALSTGRSLRVALPTAAGGRCYLVFRGGAQDCRCDAAGAAVCQPGAELLQHQVLPQGVQLQANAGSLLIDGRRGTVTPAASLQMQTGSGQQLRHVIAMTGRVRSCGGTGSLACPS
jgi:Tfp pilus assembly protein FimT